MNRTCIETLRYSQAWALSEIGEAGGLLGSIGVGDGKTILELLAIFPLRVKLALLLVPPSLVDQLIDDYLHLGQHFHVPSLVVHGTDWTSIRKGMPVLHVFAYSRLSRHEATDFLKQLRPEAIIADECDKLRHADTATTSRVLRYFAAHPETKFCGWSGSITDSSIKDYAHLAALALRERSPLPLDPEIVEEWSRALDPVEFRAPPGALLKLCDPGESVFDGYRRRFTETLGIVVTKTATIDAELAIEERCVGTVPESISTMLNDVRSTWVRPDGEELVDALSVARACRELACGFYYRWIFPRGEPFALILEWLEARKQWHRELRRKLARREEHLDSPLLCLKAAQRYYDPEYEGCKPRWESQTFNRWIEVKSQVKPETEAVRVDDYLVRDATAWATEHAGIIWYEHRAFGEWIAEFSGLPFYGPGKKAARAIVKESGDRSIIASIKSHGRGRDRLQYRFNDQLVANPPSSAALWEQLLGRLFRTGQESKNIRALFYRHTPELRAYVDKALARADYIESTMGSEQKIRSGYRPGNDPQPANV